MPEPTATLEPTATPEPTPTVEPTQKPELPIALTLASLGDNLLWVAFFDSRTQSLSAYDPSGTFSPEMALPPGQDAPDPSEIGQLTELMPGKIYFFWIGENQTVEIDGNVVDFYQGGNQIFWR